MSRDSQRPTVPIPVRREARLTRAKDALAVLGAVGALLGSAWGLAWSAIDRFATDFEVAEHDTSGQAHLRLRARLDDLEATARVQHALLRDAQAQLLTLWRWQVGYAAADRENDPRLRAAAASYYRETFDRLVRNGSPPEQAFRDSLQERWPERPRLR